MTPKGFLATLACATALAGCSFGAGQAPLAKTTPTVVPPIGAPGAAGCRPVSPAGALTGEVYGTATGGTVWALFMAGFPPQAGIEDKTVWRLDGPDAQPAPTFTLVGPAGQTGHLNWGPEFHDSSTWNRPGHEYGTGLVFPTAGCWDVHVTVGHLTGDVYVVVV
jgi:hypothetical protein